MDDDLNGLADDLLGYTDSAPDGTASDGSSSNGLSLNGVGSALSSLFGVAQDLGIGQQQNQIQAAPVTVPVASTPIDSKTILIIGGILLALILLH